ncbi:VQ motif-containing protein 31-like [Aegilops tauschii subsp. strangulata]|uniref:VQ motif-containing protein 31-like n=1 Tax=Aegilops tauschii subsp. strangulata TaxID=200361 RepID=UPI0008450175|nr:VQ motif-containing protein 31-like [Aegilops tauschii subsp. strangulata]
MERNPRTPAPRVYTEVPPATIFVRATTSTFKEVVQRLTGQPAAGNTVARRYGATVQQPPPPPVPRAAGIVSPYTHPLPLLSDMPGLCISNKAVKVNTLFPMTSASMLAEDVEVETVDAEEEKAIKEGRFYLLPSGMCRCCHGEPKLLPLFPGAE